MSGKSPNTYARRKSVGSQQRAPCSRASPASLPRRFGAIARIPSKDKMDELAEVDSDDERDWSVQGGVRRGRSQTLSLSRSSSRARLSRSSSRDLSLSRHASREPSPARSVAGKSPYSGNRSNRGTGAASGDVSPVRQSPRVSNEWTDDDARSDGSRSDEVQERDRRRGSARLRRDGPSRRFDRRGAGWRRWNRRERTPGGEARRRGWRCRTSRRGRPEAGRGNRRFRGRRGRRRPRSTATGRGARGDWPP